MATRKPRSPQEFFEHARRLDRARRHHELLAFGDVYGAAFFGRFTPDERNRLEGIFESAHNIVDLQEWAAENERRRRSTTPNQPASAGQTAPVIDR